MKFFEQFDIVNRTSSRTSCNGQKKKILFSRNQYFIFLNWINLSLKNSFWQKYPFLYLKLNGPCVESWKKSTTSRLICLLSIPKRHKYASSGKSLIEPLFVPWWNFAITLCPLWIAPNMITFLGFLVNLQAFLIGIGFKALYGPFMIRIM